MAHSASQSVPEIVGENLMDIFIKSMDSDRMGIIDSIVQAKLKDPQFPLDINKCAIQTAIRGNTQVLSKLLTLHPRMSYEDSDNRRAIHHAAISGHLECVRLLLKAGAISNCSDAHGKTPLHLACSMGHIEIVNLLVQQCAHINSCRTEMGENAVHVTASTNHLEVMELLLDHGGDINTITRKTKGGETPLQKAVLADKPDMVNFLCSRGARMDIADANGKFPIHVACEKGFIHCIRILIQHRAFLEALDHNGHTPLAVALYENQMGVAKFLVGEGANVHIVDKMGHFPLHKASLRGNLELIEQLVGAGADINARTPGTLQSPLLLAVTVGNVETIHKLISLGADVTIPDSRGHTPLHMAHLKTGGQPVDKILAAVLVGGGRLDIRDHNFLNPLQRGIVVGVIRHSQVMLPWIQLLCQAGTPLTPDEYTMGKKSPLFWLAYSGFLKEAMYLVKAGWDLQDETWIILPGKDVYQDRLHEFMIKTFKTVPSLLSCCRKALRSHLFEASHHREILSAIDSLPIPGPLKSFLKLYDIDVEDTSALDLPVP